MEALFPSFLIVAATEMGDKTQLLAFVLASRFRKPGIVLLGILAATLANHLLASTLGVWVASHVPEMVLKWILGIGFFAFAAWVLIPDRDEGLNTKSDRGAFLTTAIAFFFAEMGDKTQLSTVVMAAKYQSVFWVTFGTTLGMMVSDGLAVFLGDRLTHRVSMVWVRRFSALLFVLFGLAVILQP